MRKDMPRLLWISIAALGIVSLIQLFIGWQKGPRGLLIAVALNVVLLVGVVRGQKWGYVLTLVFGVLGIAFAFARKPQLGLAALIANGLILLPMLACTSFFFPRPQASDDKGSETTEA